MMDGGTLFEELGFYYVGPIDGHNLDHLLPVLKNVRDMETGPILVHVVTQKGKGYGPAEASADKYHAVVKFDVATVPRPRPSRTRLLSERVRASLVKEAQKDDKIVAITAAMPSGTGVDIFNKAFPDRTFDVGIAEQHAVTFAAGLATEATAFCAIYSTFLQRGYDQVVHDVAIQSLPCASRSTVPACRADAPPMPARSTTPIRLPAQFRHHGGVRRGRDGHMVATQVAINDRPSALRYPAAKAAASKCRIRRSAGDRQGPHRARRQQIALLSFGTRLGECEKAADELAAHGLSTTIADARFMKPLDVE